MEACDAGCVWHLPLQQHVRLLLQADRKAPGILSEAQVSEFSRLPQLRLVALNSDSFSSIYRMFKFLVFFMVLILDAKSEHFAHIHRFFSYQKTEIASFNARLFLSCLLISVPLVIEIESYACSTVVLE